DLRRERLHESSELDPATFEMTRLRVPGAARQHPLRRLGHGLARLAQREVRHALLARLRETRAEPAVTTRDDQRVCGLRPHVLVDGDVKTIAEQRGEQRSKLLSKD